MQSKTMVFFLVGAALFVESSGHLQMRYQKEITTAKIGLRAAAEAVEEDWRRMMADRASSSLHRHDRSKGRAVRQQLLDSTNKVLVSSFDNSLVGKGCGNEQEGVRKAKVEQKKIMYKQHHIMQEFDAADKATELCENTINQKFDSFGCDMPTTADGADRMKKELEEVQDHCIRLSALPESGLGCVDTPDFNIDLMAPQDGVPAGVYRCKDFVGHNNTGRSCDASNRLINFFVQNGARTNCCACGRGQGASALARPHSHQKVGVWSTIIHGAWIVEGHVRSECVDTLGEAKKKCEEASDCHGVSSQANYCEGKIRISHGARATIRHAPVNYRKSSSGWSHAWPIYSLTLDRSQMGSYLNFKDIKSWMEHIEQKSDTALAEANEKQKKLTEAHAALAKCESKSIWERIGDFFVAVGQALVAILKALLCALIDIVLGIVGAIVDVMLGVFLSSLGSPFPYMMPWYPVLCLSPTDFKNELADQKKFTGKGKKIPYDKSITQVSANSDVLKTWEAGTTFKSVTKTAAKAAGDAAQDPMTYVGMSYYAKDTLRQDASVGWAGDSLLETVAFGAHNASAAHNAGIMPISDAIDAIFDLAMHILGVIADTGCCAELKTYLDGPIRAWVDTIKWIVLRTIDAVCGRFGTLIMEFLKELILCNLCKICPDQCTLNFLAFGECKESDDVLLEESEHEAHTAAHFASRGITASSPTGSLFFKPTGEPDYELVFGNDGTSRCHEWCQSQNSKPHMKIGGQSQGYFYKGALGAQTMAISINGESKNDLPMFADSPFHFDTEGVTPCCRADHTNNNPDGAHQCAGCSCVIAPANDLGYRCAGEGGTCSCTGLVTYGAHRFLRQKRVAGEIECSSNNDGFGEDPFPIAKSCWCQPDTPWKKAAPGKTCKETCKSDGRWCDSTRASSIITNSALGDRFLDVGFKCTSFSNASDDGGSPYTKADGTCSALLPKGQSNCYENIFADRAPLCYCSEPNKCTGTVTDGVCSDMFGKFDFKRFESTAFFIRASDDKTEANLVVSAYGGVHYHAEERLYSCPKDGKCGAHFKWFLEPSPTRSGAYYIRSAGDSSLYIHTHGGAGYHFRHTLHPCNKDADWAHCQWYFEESPNTPGWFYIRSAGNSDLYFHTHGGTIHNLRITLHTCGPQHHDEQGKGNNCIWRLEVAN